MNITVRGRNPHDFDQFFTKSEIAHMCVETLKQQLTSPIESFDLIVEPSCGEGAFVKLLPPDKLLYMDLDATDANLRDDFLLSDLIPSAYWHISRKRDITGSTVTADRRPTCLVVGNPPFGKNSVTAMQFFNRAAQFADVIAFIVPKTFCKLSTKDKLDRRFFLSKEVDIPNDSFTFAGKTATVPCVFQIWCHFTAVGMLHGNIGVPADNMRPLAPRLTRTDDFTFVKVGESPDLIIRRVGVLAGKIYVTELHKWVTKNHYFISVTDKTHVAEVTQRLQALDLENLPIKYATAGMPSIGMTELCMAYNERYKDKL